MHQRSLLQCWRSLPFIIQLSPLCPPKLALPFLFCDFRFLSSLCILVSVIYCILCSTSDTLFIMGEAANYYNPDYYNNWKLKQKRRGPPRANFLAAANFIRNLFDGKKFNWAAMGGLAMLCLGSRREMPDMHIVYDDSDFQRIKAKLESDPRYLTFFPSACISG